MTCETCEIKQAGACTAHGGIGWDPGAGKTRVKKLEKSVTTMATETKIDANGSPNPSPASQGNGETAGTILGMQSEKPCQHPDCGCIGKKGYMCILTGPCDPHDEQGRHFSVTYIPDWKSPGKRICCKTLRSPLGTEPFQYRKPCASRPTLIDADLVQSINRARQVEAEIQRGIFADRQPFDAEKFVSDIVGS